ncbi:MAG: 1-deoxy-D-xylulose-5-phosphate reductoisomerase [Chloroflexi bacterium]|nr:1-deoxy-D-xylulose-5-phosphate reductoisomerase [Chloroflexota bacterium]
MGKRLVVLGSTGSIGCQTLEVVRAMPERLEVVGLAAGRNIDLLLEQAWEFHPLAVSYNGIAPGDLDRLRRLGCQLCSAEELAALPEADLVVVATAAGAGLRPTLSALAAGKEVALANKEVLVIAGAIVTAEARKRGLALRPVDSEHSAIWQCLLGEPLIGGDVWPPLPSAKSGPIRRLILTTSGGAVRDVSKERLPLVTATQALHHPTWNMGAKITIDSATLVNKGFEIIEAHWLFGLPYDALEVLLHRESIVHSMVEFVDGSVKAQLSPPDMRIPIQYALLYPERIAAPWPGLDLLTTSNLTFEAVDHARYPCLDLVLAAGKAGGTYPAVLSAGDEIAVELFSEGEIGFCQIPELLRQLLDEHHSITNPTLEELCQAESLAKQRCLELAHWEK